MLIRYKILDQIRNDILTCGLKPGEELREAELAEHYSVSKSPIRDALQRLEFEGLIETAPRKGHRVTPISISDARDLLEMRETLEVAAARKIVEEASVPDLEALDRFREADTGSVDAFAAYNREFHTAISALAGNRRLTDEMNRLLDAYHRLCIVSLSRLRDVAGDMREPLADHCDLIDALQARDARKAARVTQRHVRRSSGQIMKGLESRPIVE